MKKWKWLLLAAAVSVCLLTVPALAAGEVTSFSDVPEGNWAYAAVMDMVEQGMFNGTSTPVNGVGTFSPNRAMSRAEFVTVIMRHLRPEELNAMPQTAGAKWWQNAYDLARHYMLLSANDMNFGDLDRPINRQEAAVVLVRAAGMRGEVVPSLVPTSAIPDYDQIGSDTADVAYTSQQSDLQTAVRKAYAFGLLGGIDSKGTFAPYATLTRAEGATVIYRLVTPDKRLQAELVDPEDKDDYYAWCAGISYHLSGQYKGYVYDERFLAFDINGRAYDSRTGYEYSISSQGAPADVPLQNQIFKEGERHAQPQVGDTVIKADGTRVVLKLGYGLVLGAGQGVDIYTNTQIPKVDGSGMVAVQEGMAPWFEGTPLKKSDFSGEMFTLQQWKAIKSATFPGRKNGSYDGEVHSTYWVWDSTRVSQGMSGWVWKGC